jgi:hypothetical protein
MLDFLKKVWEFILAILKALGIIKDDPIIPPPEPVTAYELVVKPGCQVAVRAVPVLESPTQWRLKENEAAALGIEPTIVYDQGYKFYEIVFGTKHGWVKWDSTKMYITEKQVYL